jgi:hypothetical protein
MIFKYASTLILLLPSLALNSRIRDPSTFAFHPGPEAGVRDIILVFYLLKTLTYFTFTCLGQAINIRRIRLTYTYFLHSFYL